MVYSCTDHTTLFKVLSIMGIAANDD